MIWLAVCANAPAGTHGEAMTANKTARKRRCPHAAFNLVKAIRGMAPIAVLVP
ncbi:hypothetical protein [Mesorhizobium sp. INR15]|uniref:hypothetical protein n=1 Tax=Mesorhizobium sp. INR15 TaxID=2654248 RepID=UPI0021560904|nr:hypothetical protein [Mesorhizobium sp. INR15]